MNDLKTKLMNDAGLSLEQAEKTMLVLKSFIHEKFPMFGGMIDNFFGVDETPSGTSHAQAQADPLAEPENPLAGIFDKLGDFLPGDMGKNLEEFMKRAMDEAGDQASDLKDEANKFANRARDMFDKKDGV